MGSGQSVRKITIDNSSADVIKVSQSVVERLKSGSRTEINRENQETYAEQSQVRQNFGNFAQPTYVYPLGSIPIQEEIQKEVEKTNEYWKRRIDKMEKSQEQIDKRMKSEYEKTIQQYDKLMPELEVGKKQNKSDMKDLNQVREKLIECYKNNKDRTLNCAAEVEMFNRCFEAKRNEVQRLHA